VKILIAIDSSSYADEILSTVTSRAWANDTEFRVVTVVDSTGDWNVDQQFVHQVQLILVERVKKLRDQLPKHITVVSEVLEGTAASMIEKDATDWGANLILIGSHGDTGVRRAGIGSVAAAIVNEAPCSVEVVKLQGRVREQSKVAAAGKRDRTTQSNR
jgi:nucleotide-binding universal stress UspA family protein